MKKPYKCPICEGCGIVPGGFYSVAYGQIEGYVSSTTQEKCRTCEGRGIVYVSYEREE